MKIVQALNQRIIEDRVIERLLDPQAGDQALKSTRVISRISQFFETFEISSLEHIYFGNDVIKLRYDHIEKQDGNSLTHEQIFDHYSELFDLPGKSI